MTAPPVREFAYHRSIAPTLGMLLGIAIVETIVLHIIAVALWGWRVAMLVGALDISLVAMLVGLLRAIRRLPVTLDGERLVMRVGRLKVVRVDIGNIAGLRESWDAAAVKRRDMANLALATWPNVVVDLRAPVRAGRRSVRAIAHKLDDPAAFRASIEGAIRDRG